MGVAKVVGRMNFNLRLDHDLYQRLLLVFTASISFSYVASYLMFSLITWVSLLLPFSVCLAVLKSSLQLDVGDKSVLITGCDTGFGLSLAKHLAGLGFNVFAGCLLADKDGPGATELRKLGNPRLHVLQLDITKQKDWDLLGLTSSQPLQAFGASSTMQAGQPLERLN